MKDYNFKTISIIGGDRRQIYLADVLLQAGYTVITYGFPPSMVKNCHVALSLAEAMRFPSYVISGTPMARDHILNMPFVNEDLPEKILLEYLTPDHCLMAGNIDYLVTDYCEQNNIPYCDFMKIESLATENAIATAEGAIMKAMEKSPITLHDSPCLVLGYGKCGQVLAHKLKALDARVTVAARSSNSLSMCKANGLKSFGIPLLKENLNQFSFIFNTIPYQILNASLLKQVSPEATIIDIASSPGGIQYDVAKQLHLNATLFLGIPGKVAPKTSAELLGNKILEIIERRAKYDLIT